jgi:bifunctional non-homologous end joining protein LigD
MLATTGPLPAGPGWAYEFKWDGVRAIAVIKGGRLRLYARSLAEITVAYPELAALGAAVPDAELDGEIVLLDTNGRPNFSALAERMHVRDRVRAARLAAATPVTYMIFDLLSQDATAWIGRPYVQRRAALEELGLAGPHWVTPPSFSDGASTLAVAAEHALEGVVAKRLNSIYRPGTRSPDWIKHKLEYTNEFVIGGWRPGRRELGGLLIGIPRPDGQLQYRGRVGGGISAAAEKALLTALAAHAAPHSPFAEALPAPEQRVAHWVEPVLVVEVRYGELTPDGRLRFPRYLRLRPDRTAADVVDYREDVDG